MKTPISNELSIFAYCHCGKCIDELPEGVSPKEFQSVQVGLTKRGIQVWCKRHDCNVLNIDFEGANHPANSKQ